MGPLKVRFGYIMSTIAIIIIVTYLINVSFTISFHQQHNRARALFAVKSWGGHLRGAKGRSPRRDVGGRSDKVNCEQYGSSLLFIYILSLKKILLCETWGGQSAFCPPPPKTWGGHVPLSPTQTRPMPIRRNTGLVTSIFYNFTINKYYHDLFY